jgi:hypothetical protein
MAFFAPPQPRPVKPRPVVVELFTSEGCSSCPPADEVLRRLETQPVPGAEILPLAFHVDYWDHLGWRDPFSDGAFTARQAAYARAFGQGALYTPEMVVDGRKGFTGSADGAAVAAVREAAARPSLPIELLGSGQVLTAHCVDPSAGRARFWLAITEDGLASEVLRGENGGRRLHPVAVVRRFAPVQLDRPLPLNLPSAWNRSRLRVVVIAQDPVSLAILGAASVPLS